MEPRLTPRSAVRQVLCAAALMLAAASAMAALEVNEANQAELEMIKGIGPSLSEAILLERRQRAFSGWLDFMTRMSGIGPARAGKLSTAGLRVVGEPWPPSSALVAPAADAASTKP